MLVAPALAEDQDRRPAERHGPRHHEAHGPAHHLASGSHFRDGRGDEQGASVADRISAKLNSEGLGDHAIAVWHDGRHVTLDGRVADAKAKRRAGQLASETDGVESVENRLRVDLREAVHAPPRPPVPAAPGSRIVGDVDVHVEVNVNVNSNNGPAPPAGHQPPREPQPGRQEPTSSGEAFEEASIVRELQEHVRHLRAELEEVRRAGRGEDRREDRPAGRPPRDAAPESNSERPDRRPWSGVEELRHELRRRYEAAGRQLPEFLRPEGFGRRSPRDQPAPRADAGDEERQERRGDERRGPNRDDD